METAETSRKILADVNVLLALVDPLHQFHGTTRTWFSGLNKGDKLIICRVIQMSFLRLLCTKAVVGENSFSLKEAWSFYSVLLCDPSIATAPEPEGLQSLWASLCMRYETAAPKVLADAYLAAFAIASGHLLVSLDKGFSHYPGLQLELIT